MDDLARRVRSAVESLLENEGLTADLDDAAADVLLGWGTACAAKIACSTLGLDDPEAEEAMVDRLRATRRLMRLVDRWIARHDDDDCTADRDVLARILEQATIVYGESAAKPDEDQQGAFLRAHAGSLDRPERAIEELRRLIEGPVSSDKVPSGDCCG
jgi:hypothetical protein